MQAKEEKSVDEMTELELLLLASSSPDKTTYGIPRHMAIATGDMNIAWLMSRITFWQAHNIKKHGHNWVIRPFKEWEAEYGMSRRTFDGAIEELKKFGLEKDVRKSRHYAGNTVLHLRFDVKILYEMLKPHQECAISEFENVQNVHSTMPETNNPYITEDTTEDTTEKPNPAPKTAHELRVYLQRPIVTESVDYSKSPSRKEAPQTSSWLEGTYKNFWGRDISKTMLEKLKRPVFAVFQEFRGEYPSPMELAEHPTYGDLFRKWIMEKKNPSDKVIQVAGAKKWIDHHICNYTSPEGFLNYAKKHGMVISPLNAKNPVTVMESKLGLVEMDMFCNNLDSPRFVIPNDFREFYNANIGRVKSNEEFRSLWRKK